MIEKKYKIIYFLNEISKSFIFFICLLLITNFEKSLSFFSLFKTATPSFISVIIYISIITNKKKATTFSNNFQGFAPLQKPKKSLVLKGLDSSGKRKVESFDN